MLPLLVHFYAPGRSTLYLDGREVRQIGNDLPPGPHVVGIELPEADLFAGLFMFAAVHDQRVHKVLPEGVSESPFRLVSEADRSWLATTEEPDEYPHRWNELAFDDSGWLPLVRPSRVRRRTPANPTPTASIAATNIRPRFWHCRRRWSRHRPRVGAATLRGAGVGSE